MKKRQCDGCGLYIEGEYIKCCKSTMEKGMQRLNHVGDLCLSCWNIMMIKKGGEPNGNSTKSTKQ